jgi:outer membrane protein assembly factor BamB
MPRNLTAFAFAALFSSALAAPAVPMHTWPMYQYRPDHNAVFAARFSASWSEHVAGNIVGGLSLVGSTLYMQSFDHRLYALDPATGKVLWTFHTAHRVMTTPVVEGGVVVIGSGSNAALISQPTKVAWGILPPADAVYAVDAKTGKLLWEHVTVGEDMPTPAIVAGAIVFANGHSAAQSFAVRTGQPLWRTPLEGVSTMSSAAAVGDTVYLVSGMGPVSSLPHPTYTYALDARTGKILWKSPYGDADCSPTVGAGLVFVEGSRTLKAAPPPRNAVNTIYALNAQSGQLVWKYRSGLGQITNQASNEEGVAGVYHLGVLYQSLPSTDQFVALSAKTGRLLWTLRTEGPVKMSAVVDGGKVYFGDGTGVFYTVSAATGKVLAKAKFPLPFTPSSPLIVGQTLFVATGALKGSAGGTLYAMPLDHLQP